MHTKCHTNTAVSPDDGPIVNGTFKRQINILRINCAPSWFYLQDYKSKFSSCIFRKCLKSKEKDHIIIIWRVLWCHILLQLHNKTAPNALCINFMLPLLHVKVPGQSSLCELQF